MSEHFSREEMARCFRAVRCNECPLKTRADKLPPGVETNLNALVLEVLEPARCLLRRPIGVNSGYRCPVHNKAVGGVFNSQHVLGQAADVWCYDNKRLAEIIEENGRFDQMIIYPSFIHVSWKRMGHNRKQKLIKG